MPWAGRGECEGVVSISHRQRDAQLAADAEPAATTAVQIADSSEFVRTLPERTPTHQSFRQTTVRN